MTLPSSRFLELSLLFFFHGTQEGRVTGGTFCFPPVG